MAELNSIRIRIDDKDFTIGEPGKIENDAVMPIGIGIEELLLANQGKRLNSVGVTIDDSVTSILQGQPRIIDEETVAEVSQAVVRLLAKARIPAWKQRLQNG